MLLVALTGGIASGKSIIAGVFKEFGCYIHQSDAVAHELMEPRQPAWAVIVGHFGREILNPDNTINRKRLGDIVYAQESERLFLNKLLHPLVIKKKRELIDRLKKNGKYKIFVSEAALTIEAGFTGFFDKIVVAHCPRKIQVERLMTRDCISRDKALKKIRSQMPAEEKLPYADYIIDTSGTVQNTIEQSERVFRNLMQDSANASQ